MPKAKTPAKSAARTGFMIRLPEQYRAGVAGLATRNRRLLLSEVLIALDERFEREGVPIPARSGK